MPEIISESIIVYSVSSLEERCVFTRHRNILALILEEQFYHGSCYVAQT